MLKLKIGTLIYDSHDEEWGLITGIATPSRYITVWVKSIDQTLSETDMEQDRFEIYEV
jgi:hypothetical protein